MAIKKIITVDGIEVPFKASATLPRLYRAKFRKDIFKDFAALKDSVDESDEENSGLGIESLEVFENIAWTMAKHADPENVPDSPDEYLFLRGYREALLETMPPTIQLPMEAGSGPKYRPYRARRRFTSRPTIPGWRVMEASSGW